MSYSPVLLVALLTAMATLNAGRVSAATGVPRHSVHEVTLTSARAQDHPTADVTVKVRFTAPSKAVATVDAFWDGGYAWKVRFSPTETGKWRWRSECSDTANAGLHRRSGTFNCVPYKGTNPLSTHGPLKLSRDRRYLVHSDFTPFFWLADTAWNGVLKSQPHDWEKYLSTRQAQGFTAVQFVSTPWRSFLKDAYGNTACTGTSDIRINPEFFQRLDAKVAAINDHGLIASPVILWAVSPNDLGQKLSESDAIRLSKYIVARWGAYNVVWILGGDGNYRGDRAERWRRIGRAVFGENPPRPLTMHPGGLAWVGDEFRREPWFSFIGYQSGHGDSVRAVKWLVAGPPATEWDKSPALPVINLEPNYEGILASESRKPFGALAVRKALYRSLLVSPTAGVTYGHHGIWSWAEKPEVPLNHPSSGTARPWPEAVKSEGAESVKHLSKLFGSIRWWPLRPDTALVANRPSDPHQAVTAARSDDGTLAVIYLPQGGEIELHTKALKRPAAARWFNPSTGIYTQAGKVATDSQKLRPPSNGDWVLLIGK